MTQDLSHDLNGARDQFESFCDQCVEMGASDLHLCPLEPVVFRINGGLVRHGETPLGRDLLHGMAWGIMTDSQKTEFESFQTVDIGYSTRTGHRFRVNCFLPDGNRTAMAVRHLAQDLTHPGGPGPAAPAIPGSLPGCPRDWYWSQGPQGSGKSTTLAMLLDEINREPGVPYPHGGGPGGVCPQG